MWKLISRTLQSQTHILISDLERMLISETDLCSNFGPGTVCWSRKRKFRSRNRILKTDTLGHHTEQWMRTAWRCLDGTERNENVTIFLSPTVWAIYCNNHVIIASVESKLFCCQNIWKFNILVAPEMMKMYMYCIRYKWLLDMTKYSLIWSVTISLF